MDKNTYIPHEKRPFPPGRENYLTITEFNDLLAKYLNLKKEKQKESRGILLAIGGAGLTLGAVIASLYFQDCKGDYNPVSQNDTADADVIDASVSDAGIAYNSNSDAGNNHTDCYPPRRAELEGLQQKLETCEEELQTCRVENTELSKRPKSCPSYTPKANPKAKECPEIPYIMQGE